jgi:lipopolysaccharide export system protein LptC
METKFSAFFVLFFVFIIAISTFYLKNEVTKELNSQERVLTGDPDFFLKKFFSKQTKIDGSIKFTLEGLKMDNFDHLKKTIIDYPEYITFREGKPYSKINGEKGLIKNENNEIIIKKNVMVKRFKTLDKEELNFYTDELNLNTDTEIITSKKPVKMIQEPNIEISGIGMRFDKKDRKIKIFQDVKVRYEKPKK